MAFAAEARARIAARSGDPAADELKAEAVKLAEVPPAVKFAGWEVMTTLLAAAGLTVKLEEADELVRPVDAAVTV